jgi:hypothetical protein
MVYANEAIMTNSSLIALKRNFDTLSQGVDKYTKLNDFNDGADVFGATPFRCFPGFFFYAHLPNHWEDNNGFGIAPAVAGPILALSIIAYILGAGYYFMKCEETRHVKEMLTDEVLLSFYAMKKKSVSDQQIKAEFEETLKKLESLIEEQILRDKRVDFGYWFYSLCGWEYEGYEEKRIYNLRKFAEDDRYTDDIFNKLNTEGETSAGSSESSSSGKSGLRKTWEVTYDVVQYYSYAHWIWWMITTIVLYQTTEGYGINDEDPAHSDQPNFYTDNETGFSQYDIALIAQTVLPLIFALVVVWNKNVNVQAAGNAKADEKQQQVRAYYLEKNATDAKNLVSETHRHFYASQALTGFTTFIATFIISNVAAWPIQGLVMKGFNYKMDSDEYIPIIFAFTAGAALLNAGFKVYDMKQEEKKYFDEKGTITVNRAAQKPSVWQFFTSHDNQHKAWYNGPGLLYGSVGLLLTRILLNGGMGNLRKDGVEKMEREDILFIGLAVTAVMIFIKCAQYYTLSQRNEVLKAASDQRLPKPC